MRLLYYYGTIEKLAGDLSDYVSINFSREFEFKHDRIDFFKTKRDDFLLFEDNKNGFIETADDNKELRLTILRSKVFLPHNFWTEKGVVYNCTVFVGENGSGKTTILQNVLYSILRIDHCNYDGKRLMVLQADNILYVVVQFDGKLYVTKTLKSEVKEKLVVSIQMDQDVDRDIQKLLNDSQFVYFSNTLARNDLLGFVTDCLDYRDKDFATDTILEKRIDNCLSNYSITNRINEVLDDHSYSNLFEDLFDLLLNNRFRNEMEFVFSDISELISKKFGNNCNFDIPIPSRMIIEEGNIAFDPSKLDRTGEIINIQTQLYESIYIDGRITDPTFYIAVEALFRFIYFLDDEAFKKFKKNVLNRIQNNAECLDSNKNVEVHKEILKIIANQLLALINKANGPAIKTAIENSYLFGEFLYNKRVISFFDFEEFLWEPPHYMGGLVLYGDINKLRKNKEVILELIEKYNATLLDSKLSYLSFRWGISSGEENVLDMLSSLYKLSCEKKNTQTIQIYLDEADIGYHPEWQREWFYLFPRMVEEMFVNTGVKDIQFILATHSPLLLGDIPSRCAKYVRKSNKGDITISEQLGNESVEFETFGQNLYSVLRNGFFLDKGAIGELAVKKSDEIAKAFRVFREIVIATNKNKSPESLIMLEEEINGLNEKAKEIFKNDDVIIDGSDYKEMINEITDEIRQEKVNIKYDAYLHYIELLINQYSSFIRNTLMKEYMEIVASLSVDSKKSKISMIEREIKRLSDMRDRLEQNND